MTATHTLLGLAAHDLKNQLGGLESRLLALNDSLPHPDVAEALAHCQALRQEWVAYLTVYAAQTEGLVAVLSDESPADLLQATARRQTLPAGLTLQVTAGEDLPGFAFVDPRLLRLALDAALHNAQRFARSTITLAARAQGGGVLWTIEDDGPGPQGGSDNSSDTATGLGLALCEAVAQAHHRGEQRGWSRLSAMSTGGARFELWLP
jgi:signal transduction histidine kinase